jgi:hypothetical protein
MKSIDIMNVLVWTILMLALISFTGIIFLMGRGIYIFIQGAL